MRIHRGVAALLLAAAALAEDKTAQAPAKDTAKKAAAKPASKPKGAVAAKPNDSPKSAPAATPSASKAAPDPSAAPKPAAAPASPDGPQRVVFTPPAKPNVPDGAVEVQPGLWHYTDKDGKVWNYRRTPFGVAKYEAKDSVDSESDASDGVIAREKGEMVEFERKTPFGVSKWSKKKSDLNASERATLERSAKAAAAKE
jgi:hypothetical protein